MKFFHAPILVALLGAISWPLLAAPPLPDNSLFYFEPAKKWVEALPVGNGRLGAMVYGGVEEERIQFNEETLWTGEPHDYSHPGASEYLGEIRDLLEAGQQREATDLATEVFMSQPINQKAYQPFGDLILRFPDHGNYTNYRRDLNLETAIARVEYKVGEVKYMREVFVSHPDQVIAIRIVASKRGALNFALNLDSAHFNKSVWTDYNTQVLDVEVRDGVLKGKAGLRVMADGKITPRSQSIEISNAKQAIIYLGAHTTFVDFKTIAKNAMPGVRMDLHRFQSLNWGRARRDHIADYQSFFDRFELTFDGESRQSLPTNERIRAFWKEPNDPQFVSLYAQYGRYLMISSSRPGGQPANLQGIWNPHLSPPWESKWTLNINAEMNYWPVEIANLAEFHEPFFNLIRESSQSGAAVAKTHYGSRGWVLHHNTDIWRGAAPINASNHGIWPSGGAWTSHHLWEHYLFSQDKEFLAENYELMKGAALFFVDTLFEDPHTGWLISSPSNSPEIGGLVAGPTMDHQIVRSLFRICIEATEILDTDHAFANELKAMIPRIAPNQIGRLGQLQEWLEDKDDPEVKHRHVSHLWAVHPGNEINWDSTPELMKAAQQSLEFRGDKGTGWSLGWKINFWARFRDGNRAYNLVHNLMSPADDAERMMGGGSYPNLFDAHPPFQIDGNFGGTAGIIQLVLQSHLGSIDLLSALPDALSSGSIKGVRARGGFELSLKWVDGKLVRAEIYSSAGQDCVVRYGDKTARFSTEKGKWYTFDGNLKQVGGSSSGKHVFILSGQSNMAGLDEDLSFVPAVESKYGHYGSVVVKLAHGGLPISRWVKGWKSVEGETPEGTGDMYDQTLDLVRVATDGENIASITFLWMQGERDAKDKQAAVYRQSLEALESRLEKDLGIDQINFVVGRLSDFDMQNEKYPEWVKVRDILVEFSEAADNRSWVDTDDLNDGINSQGNLMSDDLHYSYEGYRIFGQRLADQAIALIEAGGK